MQKLVLPEDHDAGFKELPLEYRRGVPKEGWPDVVRLTYPGRRASHLLHHNMALAISAAEAEPFHPVLKACLPPEHATDEFVGRLTNTCEAELTAAALIISFGGGFSKKLEALAEVMTKPA